MSGIAGGSEQFSAGVIGLVKKNPRLYCSYCFHVYHLSFPSLLPDERQIQNPVPDDIKPVSQVVVAFCPHVNYLIFLFCQCIAPVTYYGSIVPKLLTSIVYIRGAIRKFAEKCY